MTRTRFCDASGLHALLRAHKRALFEGGELRLVIPAAGAVSGVIYLTCQDHLIPCFFRPGFDPRFGDSLAAYAQPCISGEIKRHFRDRRWQLRVRRQDQELLLEMRAAEEDLTQQLGRVPDDSQLARHLGVSEDDVREARQAHLAFTSHSLDAPLSIRA
jgi:hypothetical protein